MLSGAKWLYGVFDQGAGAASILVALIALFGALGGALASWLVAGRSVYINSITAERSKWIEKLRSNLSAYYAALDTFSVQNDWMKLITGGNPEAKIPIEHKDVLEQMHKITDLACTLQLQLNPRGIIDGNIANLIAATSKLRTANGRAIVAAEKLLIEHAQWLLKAEWEKVKYEARGPIYRLWHWRAEGQRLKEYEAWAATDGKLEPILTNLSVDQTGLPLALRGF